MKLTNVQEMLINHEGYRRHAYKCTAGKVTVGIGRNLTDRGITMDEALWLLNNDIRYCTADLLKIFEGQFEELPENVQLVLIDMRFQLGHGGFRGFKKMITAVQRNDLKEMIRQMKDSKWYSQVPDRADGLIKLIGAFIQS